MTGDPDVWLRKPEQVFEASALDSFVGQPAVGPAPGWDERPAGPTNRMVKRQRCKEARRRRLWVAKYVPPAGVYTYGGEDVLVGGRP